MDARRAHTDSEAGFTLLEVLVALSLFGVLVGLAVGPFRAYERASQEQGSARDLVSTLRNTQERAVSEARTYCVRFDTAGRSYTVGRPAGPAASPLQCDTTVKGPMKLRSQISFSSVQFTSAGGTSAVFFTPRGSATPGTVVLARDGSSKQYTISVEGLTARVTSTT